MDTHLIENRMILGDYEPDRVPEETISWQDAWDALPRDVRSEYWLDELTMDAPASDGSWADVLLEAKPDQFSQIRDQIISGIIFGMFEDCPDHFSRMMNDAHRDNVMWRPINPPKKVDLTARQAS